MRRSDINLSSGINDSKSLEIGAWHHFPILGRSWKASGLAGMLKDKQFRA
jgi:hypothetical protein